ncbi:MAG TPA: enoyl-CoA hydratase-related protein [Pseudonocardiaceae bacterium]|nr:enoyl-CoA hydratase-related protein [Pseudonocardiaceae bacterium]
MDGYQQITYDVDDADGAHGAVATIALNRPERRNGYTVRMADELADAFGRADADDAIRVVVFTGNGADFSVGADLSSDSFADRTDDPEESTGYREPAGRASLAIFEMNKPVIAAIRGAAVGAGSTIILPADYRFAAKDSRFGFVFTRRGIVPEGASTWFLPRLVGMGTALDWMISGRVFGADEALAAGLVHQLHEADDVLPAAYALAAELAAKTSPVSVAVTRQLLYRMASLDSPYHARDLDSQLIAGAAGNPDAVEGVVSFLQRRPPEFPGKVSTDLPDYLPWRQSGGRT